MPIPLRTLFFAPFSSAFINRWRLQTGKKYRLLANKIRPHCTAGYTNDPDPFLLLTLDPY